MLYILNDKFGMYARLFPLINDICIYSGNLPLEVLPTLFYSDVVSVELLDSYIVLIFPYSDNLLVHQILLF